MERLGDFEIDGVLGEGGSGIVYAARRTEEELALKVLRPDLALSERELASFVAEAQRVQRAAHASLVAVRDVGVLPDGRPYLAMPRLHGEILALRIARGPMALDLALRLFRGLAEAIDLLHAAGLVHRDIKPENVFVVGDDERLVLLDLGIARDADAPASTTTQAGLVRGTPAYMAPERFFGARASALTDTYEAAVVLYAMLTSRLPWDHAQEARGRLSPRDPRSSVPLPEPVAQALLRALSVDETARPRSVVALADELDQAAISTAETKLSPVLPAARTLASAVADASARSAAPPNDFATQDTVAVSTGRVPRRSPAWAPPVFAACVLAGAIAGVWAFLARPAPEVASPTNADPAPTATVARTPADPVVAATASAEPAPATSATAEPASVITTSTAASHAPVASASSVAAPPAAIAAPSNTANPNARATSTGRAAGAPTQTTPTTVTLTNCFALVAIYCAPDFKATDGGSTCTGWMNNVQSFQLRPRDEWPALDAACASARTGALLTLNERRRQMAPKPSP